MTARQRLGSESGYSLVELLVSSAIMLTVTGAIFSLVNPAQGTSKAQPEAADLQQRMRIGTEMVFSELMMVGAGTYQGPVRGALVNYFAPILPRRTGRIDPDGPDVFRPDALTVSYIPNTYSQTTISGKMPPNSNELKVNPQPNCPPDTNELCGFHEGMTVIIFDVDSDGHSSGHFDTFEITKVQLAAGHLQHKGQDLNYEYKANSAVTQVVSHTLYLDRNTNQLKRYDGGEIDVPLVDNVVDMQVSYYGDVNPPKSPKPVLGEANCLYDAMGNYIGPGTLNPDEGALAELTPAMLTDGPFCGGGSNQFDPDLLRVRKVRVTLRMQAGDAALRGVDTRLWRNPGKSQGGERLVPDYLVSFDVTPRNLNLAR